jgi:VIT1/CCC1 family predicted Fe2+/Mn2+ transporter
MASRRRDTELHLGGRMGWLRAAVLGANDGIVSTASLLIGVAAAGAGSHELLLAGAAGVVAGAMSMAAGEYVAVSSLADAERADLERERRELATDETAELHELARIYVRRGLDAALARAVAAQLMAHDALGAHARDELGILEQNRARPWQAAIASCISFGGGGLLPLVVALASPRGLVAPLVAAASLACLALTGALAARVGGAGMLAGAGRVCLGGTVAMALTAAIGLLVGVAL